MKLITVEFVDGTLVEKKAKKILAVNKDSIEYIDENGEELKQSTKGFNTGKHAIVTITEVVETKWQVVKGLNTDLVWHQLRSTFHEDSEVILKDNLTFDEAKKLALKIDSAMKGNY